MKYLKYFNIDESLDDTQQHLKDIFTDLIDEGYSIDIFRGYDDDGESEYRVTIRNKDLSRLLIFDLLISNTLKNRMSAVKTEGILC